MDAVRMIMEAECKCEHGNITVGECAKILSPLHDVEPVVRCKDCKYVEMLNGSYCCDKPNEDRIRFRKGDWFCADGERKEG